MGRRSSDRCLLLEPMKRGPDPEGPALFTGCFSPGYGAAHGHEGVSQPSASRPLGMRQLGFVHNFGSQEPVEALYFVKPGKYKVSILQTSGAMNQKTVDIGLPESRIPDGTATD